MFGTAMTNKQKAILYTTLICLGFAVIIILMAAFPNLLEFVPYFFILGVAFLCAYGFFILPIYEAIKDHLDRKTKEENYQLSLQIEMEAAQAKAEQIIRDNSPYPLDDVKATVQKIEPGDLY
jgi:arginine exporter protein ArgO